VDNEEVKVFGQALSRAMFYCSRAEHCPADVFDKLSQWQVPEELWDKIVAKLTEENFLSEERFTRAYVLDKIRYNKWGKQKVAFQLRAKQIPRSAIDTAFLEIDDDEYRTIIQYELEKKCLATKEPDSYKLKAKLVNFAASRGYEIDLCNPIIDNLLTR
jgi:regulatory protein